MSEKILYPISFLVKDLIPPEIAGSIDEALDFLAVDLDHTSTEWTNFEIATRFRIHILQKLELQVPLLPGFVFRVGEGTGYPYFDLVLATHPVPKIAIDHLAFTVHVPPAILQAYERTSDGGWRKKDTDGYDFTFATGLVVDTHGGFEIKSPELTGLPPFMIGDTGFVLDFSESRSSDDPTDVYFVSSEAPPEIAQKLPPGFKGFYIARAGIHYYKPDSGTRLPRIGLEHAAIGSGGFTGGAIVGDEREEPAVSDERLNSPDFNPDELEGDHIAGLEIAGMKMILWHLRVSFFQSVPDAFLLTGLVFVPFANKWMKFRASVGGPDADFLLELGGAADKPLIDLNLDWLEIEITNMGYKTVDGVHYVIIDGSIRPKLPGFNWPKMLVEDLSISSEGDVDIPGGWLKAPEAVTLDFHGFKINITEIGFGTEGEEEDKREWFGLSGGISLVEGLPLKASVEGLKFSWRPGAPSEFDVTLRGISLRLEIPNTLLVEGHVSYKRIGEDDESPTGITGHVFAGHARLDLYALRTEVAAELLIGRVTDQATGESFTAFFIVLAAELPTGIPLGATGAALYGLKGLFGMHVAPDRQLVDGEPEPWYRWYKEKRGGIDSTAYNVTSVVKWAPRHDHFAFGAGITLGTYPDDGFTLNAGALVAILIPGPVVMIEGRANLLQDRGASGEKTEGAMYALAVFDGLASTFQLNVDVQFNLENVIEVGGGLEAFFDFNDSNRWHIYIGRKEPLEKRIKAKVLAIVTANCYLMIDPNGIFTGAWVGVTFDESFGPVRLVLKAYLAFDAGVMWKNPQLEAAIELYAEVGVYVFGIGIGLLLQTILAGKAPEPYWIYGKARVALSLPFPLPSFDVEVEFEWGEEGRPNSVSYLKGASLVHHKLLGASWEMLSLPAGTEPDDGDAVPVVPVDATPVLSFAKPLYGLSARQREDGSVEELVTDRVDDWEFTYNRPAVELHVREADGSWRLVKQSPLQVGDISDVTPFDIRRENLLPDVFAREPQLALWQYGPLSLANRPAREDFVPHCPEQERAPLVCFDWQSVPSGTVYPLEFVYEGVTFALPLAAHTSPARVQSGMLETTSFSMRFPEPMDSVEIHCLVPVEPNRVATVRAEAYSQGTHVTDLTSEVVGAGELRLYVPDESSNPAIDLVRVYVKQTGPGSGSTEPGGGTVVPGLGATGPALPQSGPSGSGLPAPGATGPDLPTPGLPGTGGIVTPPALDPRVPTPPAFDPGASNPEALKQINPGALNPAIDPGSLRPGIQLPDPSVVRLRDVLSGGGQGQTNPQPGGDTGGGIDASGRIYVTQVCYRTTRAAHREQLTAPASEDAGADEAFIRGLELQPNRLYRLTVETTRTERQIASSDGERSIAERAMYYFRTGDVPGTAYPDGAVPGFADTPLNDLGTYVRETIPAHGAGVHYRDYDVAFTFNEVYARDFYSDLRIRLRDRNGKLVGEPAIGTFLGWLPLVSDGLVTYFLGLAAHPCDSAPIPPAVRREYHYRSTRGLLAPNRMYRAEIVSPSRGQDRPLYAFQFTTSRFATAAEHLTSGLRDRRQIVRTLPAGPRMSLSLDKRPDLEATVRRLQGEVRELAARLEGRLTLALLEKLEELAAAENELEAFDAEAFDKADAAVQPLFERLGMGQRPLPPVLELVHWPFERENRSYLLLESPEPIERRRVTATVLRRSEELPIHVIWNRDGTRAFLVPQDNQGFEPGNYTLRLSFSGGGPDRPDLAPLTVDGVVVNEVVNLPFRL